MNSELNEKLVEIKSQKDTYLLPTNLKKDVTVLGVTGTYEGINTSDATAIAKDIISGKTAYTNGNKITGSLTDNRNVSTELLLRTSIDQVYSQYGYVKLLSYGGSSFPDCVIGENTEFISTMDFNTLATAFGVTAGKIKLGETILGVTGTYAGTTVEPIIYVDYNEQQILVDCDTIADLITAEFQQKTYNIEDCNIVDSPCGTYNPFIKLCNIQDTNSANSLNTGYLGIAIDVDEKTIYFVADTGSSKTVLGTFDYSGASSIEFGTRLDKVIVLLRYLGVTAIDLMDMSGIAIYNDFSHIAFTYLDDVMDTHYVVATSNTPIVEIEDI